MLTVSFKTRISCCCSVSDLAGEMGHSERGGYSIVYYSKTEIDEHPLYSIKVSERTLMTIMYFI